MPSYYTAVIFLSVAAMLVIQLCVSKSGTLAEKSKKLFHLLFTAIAVAAFCEWLGVVLQGTGSGTRVLHIVVKVLELSLAPSISVWLAWTIERRRDWFVFAFLVIHALAEALSGVYGFIFQVDADSNYTHAGLYWIYVAAYGLTILYCMFIVFSNMKKYQYSGIGYFLSLVTLMLVGIVLQLYDSNLRTVYFTLAIASIMLYVFTLEMIHQTDDLTELINRRGYDNCIAHVDEKCVIIFFDVDRFKQINDTYGHAFGDVVLRTIGSTIREQYSRCGKCFRYGGDEFCVLLEQEQDRVEAMNASFFEALAAKRQKEPRLPFVSIGYVHYDPATNNVEDAVAEADQMMYRYKAVHRQAHDATAQSGTAEEEPVGNKA